MDGRRASLINKRGRIIWVEERDVPKAIKEMGMKLFPNPKQDYYPAYDNSFPSPNAPAMLEEAEGDALDVEVIT